MLTAGPNMAHLHDALGADIRGPHYDTSQQLIAPLLATLQPGDVVMIKGSLGSRMGQVVDALMDTGDFDQQANCG